MSSYDTSTVSDNQIADPFKTSLTSLGSKRSRQGSFKASIFSEGYKRIPSTLLHEFTSQQDNANVDRKYPPSMVFVNIDQRHTNVNTTVNKDKKDEEEEEEDVSPEFINEFNRHIGNSKKKEKARRLIEKMKQIGGLIPALENQEIDVPEARMGLSYLASLNHQEFKMEALDNLLLLLQNDTLEKESSVKLVNLTISLMRRMNRELMQTEILDIQIKITQVYSLVAELLQRHYTKKHINAITKELKIELIETTKALQALNTQEDPKLNFYTKCALEGVRHIVDDRKELFDLIERFCHALIALYALQADQGDASTGFQELVLTFKDLDPHLPSAWYNGVLILNELAKEARTDPAKLTAIQVLLREKGKKFNWKFTYAAVEILAELSLHGETQKIRETAFHGIQVLGPDFPGLTSFVDKKDLSKYVDMSPMVHLKKPRRKNPNTVIRLSCTEHLAKIANESNDITIRKKAKLLLIQRLSQEKKESILAYLKMVVPQSKEEQADWIKES